MLEIHEDGFEGVMFRKYQPTVAERFADPSVPVVPFEYVLNVMFRSETCWNFAGTDEFTVPLKTCRRRSEEAPLKMDPEPFTGPRWPTAPTEPRSEGPKSERGTLGPWVPCAPSVFGTTGVPYTYGKVKVAGRTDDPKDDADAEETPGRSERRSRTTRPMGTMRRR